MKQSQRKTARKHFSILNILECSTVGLYTTIEHIRNQKHIIEKRKGAM